MNKVKKSKPKVSKKIRTAYAVIEKSSAFYPLKLILDVASMLFNKPLKLALTILFLMGVRYMIVMLREQADNLNSFLWRVEKEVEFDVHVAENKYLNVMGIEDEE